jgi:hypothetical protein
MNIQSGFRRHLLISVAAIALVSPIVHAAETLPPPGQSPGAIVGIVRNSDKVPVSGATITAVRAGGGAIRATLSGSDGVYSFADLAPGTWSLALQVDGYPEVSVPTLQVVPSKATRYDVIMSIPSAAAAALSSAPALPAQSAAASPPATSPAAAVATVPEALQAPEAGPEVDTKTPWAQVGYVGWMNGTSREKAPIFDTKFFTPEIRLDMNYLQSLNHPHDHTIVGSTEEFRSGEFQIEQVSLGGDFHWDNVHARFLSMFGMFATTTPRNDASSAVGQWDLQNAYRYFSEASAGYHFDVNHGLNVDVSALLRVVQYTVVLQRTSCAVVADTKFENRALAHQWLAILRQVQQQARIRRANIVDSERLIEAGLQQLFHRTRQFELPKRRKRHSRNRRHTLSTAKRR